MVDFIQACLEPVNLLLTVLLGLCVAYWGMVILGALSMNTLDVDFDSDMDMQLDIDADADLDIAGDLDGDFDADLDAPDGGLDAADASPGAGVGIAMLRFFNVGDVPLMILLTIAIGVTWAVWVPMHHQIAHFAVPVQFLLLIPYFIAAMFVTKFLTLPIKAVFQKMREEERRGQKLDAVGKTCRVTSFSVSHKHGQAELPTTGAPILLHVRTASENETLNKGDQAVIVSQFKNQGIFIIRAADHASAPTAEG